MNPLLLQAIGFTAAAVLIFGGATWFFYFSPVKSRLVQSLQPSHLLVGFVVTALGLVRRVLGVLFLIADWAACGQVLFLRGQRQVQLVFFVGRRRPPRPAHFLFGLDGVAPGGRAGFLLFRGFGQVGKGV